MSSDRPYGQLGVGLAAGDSLRWAAADFTAIVEDARQRLDLSPVAAAALGRTLIGAALLLRLSSGEPRRLVLELRGDGPLQRVVAEADVTNNVRGSVARPRADVPPGRKGKLAVGPGIGEGLLRVRREYAQGSYQSEVELVTGEVGKDLANFLLQSEQVRAAVLLGVLADPNGIVGAGGVIVEALPGVSEQAVATVEDNIAALSGVSRTVATEGSSGLLDRIFDGIERRHIESRIFHYECRCSRERIGRYLALLPMEEVLPLRLEDSSVRAKCVFCGAHYRFVPAELEVWPVN